MSLASPPKGRVFIRLDKTETAALERMLRARDRLAAAEIDAVRARVRTAIADAFITALKPDSPRRVRLEADLLRRRADGLQRAASAAGARRWIRAQFVRAFYSFKRGGDHG